MSTQLRPEDFPPFMYGLHEAGGEHLMVNAGRPGWVLEMATVGHDPGGVPSGNFTQLVWQGLRVIIRLHHGFGSAGTIPRPEFYASFAQACATFVARCQGARTWIIGNEPNHAAERPGQIGRLPALEQHYDHQEDANQDVDNRQQNNHFSCFPWTELLHRHLVGLLQYRKWATTGQTARQPAPSRPHARFRNSR